MMEKEGWREVREGGRARGNEGVMERMRVKMNEGGRDGWVEVRNTPLPLCR